MLLSFILYFNPSPTRNLFMCIHFVSVALHFTIIGHIFQNTLCIYQPLLVLTTTTARSSITHHYPSVVLFLCLRMIGGGRFASRWVRLHGTGCLGCIQSNILPIRLKSYKDNSNAVITRGKYITLAPIGFKLANFLLASIRDYTVLQHVFWHRGEKLLLSFPSHSYSYK